MPKSSLTEWELQNDAGLGRSVADRQSVAEAETHEPGHKLIFDNGPARAVAVEPEGTSSTDGCMNHTPR